MKNAAQASKERREKLKSKGLCTFCGKIPSVENRVKCEICIANSDLSNKKYRENHPDRIKIAREKWKTDPKLRARRNKQRQIWRRKYKHKVILFFGGKC